MKDLPSSFYAGVYIFGAIILAGCALFAPIHEKDVTLAVLGLCASVITGAFGYIQGHKDGAASVPIMPGQNPAQPKE